jgi:hypothetical protein
MISFPTTSRRLYARPTATTTCPRPLVRVPDREVDEVVELDSHAVPPPYANVSRR